MADLIDAIIQARKTASNIFVKSLTGIVGKSEAEVRDKILQEAKNHREIFETGWYDPPAGGLGILFADYPFKRLKYDSLRKPDYAPNKNITFGKERVGMVYSSFVDRKTKMLGDIGFPLYVGQNEKIKQHIKNVYNAILGVAEHAKVGMKFSDLCLFSENLFRNKFKPTRWIIVSKNLNQPTNLGHTIPGSLGDNLVFGNTIEKIKETIRTNRVFIINNENFSIPENCAFTLESRLEDTNDPDMPSVYFHFIIIFNNGEKMILKNFNEIFNAIGMDYI